MFQHVTTTFINVICSSIRKSIIQSKSIPTLQEKAINDIALFLWKTEAMRARITLYFETNEGLTFYNRELCTLEPEYEFFPNDWNRVEQYMFQQITQMNIRPPQKLEQELNHAIAMIGMQIKEWQKCLLMLVSPASGRHVLKHLANFPFWTPHGEISKEFFVEILFDSGKFKILDIIEDFPLHYSYIPIEYFWHRLDPAVREEFIEKFSSDENLSSYREDTFLFLLSQTNELQLISIIKNNPYGLIRRLVSSTRPWQSYFTMVIYYLYIIITEEQRSGIKSWLIKQVALNGYYYRKILLYLWDKEYHDYLSFANPECEIHLLFNIRDLDVYKEMIKKAKMDVKRKIIVSAADMCIHFFNNCSEISETDNCKSILDKFFNDVFGSKDSVNSAKIELARQGWCCYGCMIFQPKFTEFLQWALSEEEIKHFRNYCCNQWFENNF